MAKLEVVPCNPVRTAIGTYGGALMDTAAPALGTGNAVADVSRSPR